MPEFRIVSVTPHRRRDITCPMYHVVLRRPGRKGIDLYLTVGECAEYGIEVPTLAVVK